MQRQTRFIRNIENVVIISLDCVRPEALGCYPQRFPWRARFLSGARTPTIDRLCAAGHRFDQAITHAPFTPAAHASLFTGLLPPQHGIRTLLGARLREDVTTLAEVLSAAGWQCGAVVGAHALSREYGLSRGFHHYDDEINTGIRDCVLGQRRGAIDVTDRAIAWLGSLKNRRRFFLFVHYFDAHDLPSQPNSAAPQQGGPHPSVDLRQLLPEWLKTVLRPVVRVTRSGWQSAARGARMGLKRGLSYFEATGRYERYGRRYQLSQVAKVDAQIGRLVNALADQDKLDQTLIVILADHGDDFMEHGEPTHRKYLYDTTLRVPLIVHSRLGPRRVIQEQVRLADVFPTVLSTLGIESEGKIDGESLIDLLNGPPAARVALQSRKAFSETVMESTESDVSESGIVTCYASLRVPPWKLIWNRIQDTYELYRLDVDPHEERDRASDNPNLVNTMSKELRELAQAMPVAVDPGNDVIVERLKALGYL